MYISNDDTQDVSCDHTLRATFSSFANYSSAHFEN